MDDDEDSLFGSPPPEAAPAITRGRSPSPLLALPGSSTAASSTLLSSTSTSTSTAQTWTSTPNINLQEPTPPSYYRPPRQRPPPKKSKPKPRATTPHPGPQIELPGPDASLPPNFLRNQSALLGLAGLVGHVRPANLTMPRGESRERGATPCNPIVLDDIDGVLPPGEQPAQSPPRWLNTASSRPFGNINPADLPAPSHEEIVASLMNQKDIFPILESIIKLITRSNSGGLLLGQNQNQPSTSPIFDRSSRASSIASFSSVTSTSNGASFDSRSSMPPLKRRKLSKVPAGAADWDVPYPFPPGEGPQAYHGTWEQARSRQLVGQLVSLIKHAARQAAVKKYMREHSGLSDSQQGGWTKAQGTVRNHYRPRTAVYGTHSVESSSPASPSYSSRPWPSPFPHNSASNIKQNPTTGIARNTDCPNATSNDFSINYITPSATTSAMPSPASSSLSDLPDSSDPAMLNAWLSFLQSLPSQDGGGFLPMGDSNSDLSSNWGDFSMLDLTNIGESESLDLDLSSFGFAGSTEFFSTNTSSTPENVQRGGEQEDTVATISTPPSGSSTSAGPPSSVSCNPLSVGDSVIDPELLALSTHDPMPTAASRISADPSITALPDLDIGAPAQLGDSAMPLSASAPPSDGTVAAFSFDFDSLAETTGPPSLASPGPSAGSRAESPEAVTPRASNPADVHLHVTDIGFGELGHDAGDVDPPLRRDKGKGKASEETLSVDIEAFFRGSADPNPGAAESFTSDNAAATSGAPVPNTGMFPSDVMSLLMMGRSPPELNHQLPSTSAAAASLAYAPAAFLLSGAPAPTAMPPAMPTDARTLYPLTAIQNSTTTPQHIHLDAQHRASSLAQPKRGSAFPHHQRVRVQPKDPAAQRAHRVEVLQRARERRLALVAELERAKVELWECTVEQGVLVQLGREVEKIGSCDDGASSETNTGLP